MGERLGEVARMLEGALTMGAARDPALGCERGLVEYNVLEKVLYELGEGEMLRRVLVRLGDRGRTVGELIGLGAV